MRQLGVSPRPAVAQLPRALRRAAGLGGELEREGPCLEIRGSGTEGGRAEGTKLADKSTAAVVHTKLGARMTGQKTTDPPRGLAGSAPQTEALRDLRGRLQEPGRAPSGQTA